MGKRYKPDFMEAIGSLVVDDGQSQKAVAKAMNVSRSSVDRWSRSYRNRLATIAAPSTNGHHAAPAVAPAAPARPDAIEVVESLGLGFTLGLVVERILAGDLDRAASYLGRAIDARRQKTFAGN